MLLNLTISNFAIIDHLDVPFKSGLNVLTGETGAGKSIIIGALSAILGGKAGAETIRSGADRASIDAVFNIQPSDDLAALLDESGLRVDEELILSRDIASSGKSSIRINGRPATITLLRQVGEYLVDLHGQHEHQSLLSVARHMDFLDDWAGKEIVDLRDLTGLSYHNLQVLQREYASIMQDARDKEKQLDLYHFQLDEINAAGLDAQEEEHLQADEKRLANSQKLAELVDIAASFLSSDSEKTAIDCLAQATDALENASAIDEELSHYLASLQNAMYEVEEVSRDIIHYRDEIEFNPKKLDQIEDRLDLIRSLKRKYGNTIGEILAFAHKIEDEIGNISHNEQRKIELQNEIQSAEIEFANICSRLSQLRREKAEVFGREVKKELDDLAMNKTRFDVRVDAAAPGQKGADDVEFMISPNPGEPLRPLARIASGGEISRVMLAIKSAMARRDSLPTMVFDEIDVGVGGHTAVSIGQKMHSLAKNAQIICITHLPQIASLADYHLLIEKSIRDDRTYVQVMNVEQESRVDEIARMLGGINITPTVLEHAREMLRAGAGNTH
jgi:DNA repair protein RecN (Recombination protein N)